MQSRTLVTAPISNYKKIVVHYIKQTSRSDILISFLVHCLGTFFFHCLPSFTHNYEGRHEEASLPIASSRCRSNLSDWRSESEEIKSPVVKIPPLSVFEDDDLFFWDFFFYSFDLFKQIGFLFYFLRKWIRVIIFESTKGLFSRCNKKLFKVLLVFFPFF